MLRIVVALTVLTGSVVATTQLAPPAAAAPAADIPFTYLNEQFTEASFPPANWTVTTPATVGTWAASCPAPAPSTGCQALATMTAPAVGDTSKLFFNPAQGIPANLQNPTLSFYSDFTPTGTAGNNRLDVKQPLIAGSVEDFRLITHMAGGPEGDDATGVPVLHTVALTSIFLPLIFTWQSLGDSGTWGISDVMITGTVPATPYVLTADPVSNLQNHPVAGTPITINLSGSSNPVGDSLNFAIVAAPHIGQLGPITTVDATHAKVVYTAPVTSCPDPTGFPGFICTDPFTFKVTDATGNESTPAQVNLDLNPGGAGGQQIIVTAPSSANYTTINQGGTLTPAVDLAQSVTIGPAGFPDAVQLNLQAAVGTISLPNAGITSQVTFLNGTTKTGAQINMSGSVAALTIALSQFFYFPPEASQPTTTVKLFAGDLGPVGTGGFFVQTSATININAPSTDPVPVLTMPTGPLAVATNGGPLSFPAGHATGFSLTDPGAGPATNDTVHLSVNAGALALPASDTSGPAPLVTVVTNTGSLDITGTVAQLNQALSDLTFDPSHLSSQTVTLTASVSDPDSGLGTIANSVQITVTMAPFVSGPILVGTLQDVPTLVLLCGIGPVGHPVTVTVTGGPTHGTLVADPSANTAGLGCTASSVVKGYRYTPANGYVGPDAFTYTVRDSTTALTSDPQTVAITVAPHVKPSAFDVSALTQQDVPVDVILCASNPETTTSLIFAVATQPTSGVAVPKGVPAVNSCAVGSQAMAFTYTPNAGSFATNGADQFTYTVSNGAASDPATATITVSTRTPQVFDETVSVNENGSVGINLCATAPTGAVTFAVTAPQHGTLDAQVATQSGPLCPVGSFGFGYKRYVPTALYRGADTFTYTATSGAYTSAPATVHLTVDPVEVPPTADAQHVTVIAPHAVPVTLTGSSPHGLPITYRVTSPPTLGVLTGTAPNLIYTPSVSSGLDAFTFVTNDGVADSAPTTVSVTITTPNLTSSACIPGSIPIGVGQFACVATLQSVSDGNGGVIGLARTPGGPVQGATVQVVITNGSPASDQVTLSAAAAASPWTVRYFVAGNEVTSQLTGGGFTITLGPAGSATRSVYVQVMVAPPGTFPSTASTRFTLTAVSGNDQSTSTSTPVEVADGTSSPVLRLEQIDRTGTVTFPVGLHVVPALAQGGSLSAARILPGLTGTGQNTLLIKSTVLSGASLGVAVRYLLGTLTDQTTTDVTSDVQAGTLRLDCSAVGGCPPLFVIFAPGTGSGALSLLLSETSAIDGQSSPAFMDIAQTGTVGPDLSTNLPNEGLGVFEDTPVTQLATKSVQVSGTTTKVVFLQNTAAVADVFTVSAAFTRAAGDGSSVSISQGPPGFPPSPTPSSDVTGDLFRAIDQVHIGAGQAVLFTVFVRAGSTPGLAAPDVTFTASSGLVPARIDSLRVTFPTYFYRPDASLTAADGSVLGAAEYNSPGDQANPQTTTVGIDQSPTDIAVQITERGKGTPLPNDQVVVRAPASDANFDLSYALTSAGHTTDVTDVIAGSGLTLSVPGNGGPAQTVTMSAAATASSAVRTQESFPITVTSSLSPSPQLTLTDTVIVRLRNVGDGQLTFAGAPQSEPTDVRDDLFRRDPTDYRSRTLPLTAPSGYVAGTTYGNYSDRTGKKFVYASAYDTFGLQVKYTAELPETYRVQMIDTTPGHGPQQLPVWANDAFSQSYFNEHLIAHPADPLGLDPKFTLDGRDVTSEVKAGTLLVDSHAVGASSRIVMSFTPPAGDSQRYNPLRFNLINNATGKVEDVIIVALSSILQCSDDINGQQLATSGKGFNESKLAFRSFDRGAADGLVECMQRLTHSWVTKKPVVFSSYVPENVARNEPAGGYDPKGLWLVPQGGVITIDSDTLAVTSATPVKAYVDSPVLDSAGVPVATSPVPMALYYPVGDYPTLNWKTKDLSNGLLIKSTSGLPRAPFPLVAPNQTDSPGNTMTANRYFQVNPFDGAPQMTGEMNVNEPWLASPLRLHFAIPIGNATGLVPNYPAPPSLVGSLPGAPEVTTYAFYWTTRSNGSVTQNGCLGLPPHVLLLFPDVFRLGDSDISYCFLSVTTLFQPQDPADITSEVKIAQITFGFKGLAAGSLGTPEFNVSSLSGQIDLDPTDNSSFKSLVLNVNFGVGPPTPCQLQQNKDGVVKSLIDSGLFTKVGNLACPSNYFFFNTEIVYNNKGGVGAQGGATTGQGLSIVGTLNFLGFINLASLVAQISTSPFLFHFEYNPVDVSLGPSVPFSIKIGLAGDITDSGFDLILKGSFSAFGYNIASAEGILSSLGFALCGSVAGTSMGVEDKWGEVPVPKASGCNTAQFVVKVK